MKSKKLYVQLSDAQKSQKNHKYQLDITHACQQNFLPKN
jgi:hypothetical protein